MRDTRKGSRYQVRGTVVEGSVVDVSAKAEASGATTAADLGDFADATPEKSGMQREYRGSNIGGGTWCFGGRVQRVLEWCCVAFEGRCLPGLYASMRGVRSRTSRRRESGSDRGSIGAGDSEPGAREGRVSVRGIAGGSVAGIGPLYGENDARASLCALFSADFPTTKS